MLFLLGMSLACLQILQPTMNGATNGGLFNASNSGEGDHS